MQISKLVSVLNIMKGNTLFCLFNEEAIFCQSIFQISLTTFLYIGYIIYIYYSDVIFQLSVGRPKHIRVMAGALEGELFIGPKAEVRT